MFKFFFTSRVASTVHLPGLRRRTGSTRVFGHSREVGFSGSGSWSISSCSFPLGRCTNCGASWLNWFVGASTQRISVLFVRSFFSLFLSFFCFHSFMLLHALSPLSFYFSLFCFFRAILAFSWALSMHFPNHASWISCEYHIIHICIILHRCDYVMNGYERDGGMDCWAVEVALWLRLWSQQRSCSRGSCKGGEFGALSALVVRGRKRFGEKWVPCMRYRLYKRQEAVQNDNQQICRTWFGMIWGNLLGEGVSIEVIFKWLLRSRKRWMLVLQLPLRRWLWQMRRWEPWCLHSFVMVAVVVLRPFLGSVRWLERHIQILSEWSL